jgi:hypothetical protein
MSAAQPHPYATDCLWKLVLAKLSEHPLTRELWPRDRPRLDETLLELFVLGERPSVSEVRGFLAEIGASPVLAREARVRWRRRLENPGWRPRELIRSGPGWVTPFYLPDLVVREHALRDISDRLGQAITVAARDYMQRSASDRSSVGTSVEGTVFVLTAAAVRLWSLSQDSVADLPWPSILSRSLTPHDTLAGHWTNSGRAREQERLDRWAAEDDARL